MYFFPQIYKFDGSSFLLYADFITIYIFLSISIPQYFQKNGVQQDRWDNAPVFRLPQRLAVNAQ